MCALMRMVQQVQKDLQRDAYESHASQRAFNIWKYNGRK